MDGKPNYSTRRIHELRWSTVKSIAVQTKSNTRNGTVSTQDQDVFSFKIVVVLIHSNCCYIDALFFLFLFSIRPIQTKQLITDEKMAAHLNGLHISSDFRAHNSSQSTTANDALDIDVENSAPPIPIPCSLQDIEEKLKRANKITVSDVVKKFQEEPLLPAAILERFEKPSKALVIWQPPQRITDLIISKAAQEQKTEDDEDLDNNNVELANVNNDSQMDLDG